MKQPSMNSLVYIGAAVVVMCGVSLATICDEVYDYNEWNDDGTVGDSGCRETNHSPICSGRGTCTCGQCECQKRPNPDEKVSGQFCECTNFLCPRSGGQLCGGLGRGRCECNVCRCHPGWSGKACTCNKGSDDCVNPENGLVCSGNGECDCNECRCYSLGHSGRYSGKYCQDCPTCRGSCSAYKACVQCQVFGTGELSQRECENQCTFFNATTVTKAVPGPDERLCNFYDKDGCRFSFVYGYDHRRNPRVMVQNKLDCPMRDVRVSRPSGIEQRDNGEGGGVSRKESSFLVLLSLLSVIVCFSSVCK